MQMNRKTIVIALWSLLALVGVVNILWTFVGTGRNVLGALFYQGEQARELIESADQDLEPYLDACGKESLREPFDQSTVQLVDEWCEAVRAFHEEPGPDLAVELLRYEKLHFDEMTGVLLTDVGGWARPALDLMRTDCNLRPKLESIGSITASASFSQFLAGFLLTLIGVVGILVTLRRYHTTD